MATIFSQPVQEAFNAATKLTLTQAFIIAVQEDEERTAMYQCKVMPDLLDIENEQDCPWYPLMETHKKKDIQEGDLVWMYVTSDLGVGFVWDKANSLVDQPDQRMELWEALTEGLSELDSDSDFETPIDVEIAYETTYYWQIFESVYVFFDKEKNHTGIIDVENNAAVLLKDDKLHIRIGELHAYGDVTIKGEEHYSEGNWEIIGEEHKTEGDWTVEGDEHKVKGDIEYEGDHTHKGDMEHEGDLTHKGDTEQDGSSSVSNDMEIGGSLVVAGGSSPVARANETLDIIDQVETHIHATPAGPSGPPLTPSQAPLAAQLIALKQTLASTTTEVD